MDSNRAETYDVKKRLFVLVSAGMVLPAVFLFSVVAYLPHVFIIACCGYVISLMIRTPIRYSDRSIIYSTVVSLILVILLNLVFPMKPDRFFHIGRLFMSNITVPLVIYLAIFATFYESSAYTLGINAAFALVALLFGGDYRIGAVAKQRFHSFNYFQHLLEPEVFRQFFLVTAGVVTCFILLGFFLACKSKYHKKLRQGIWQKQIAYLASVASVILICMGMLFLFNTYRNSIRQVERFMNHLRLRNLSPPVSGVIFEKEVDLNETIKADRKKNSKVIMLRVTGCGNEVPGYLRGRSYQYYSGGKWRDNSEASANMHFRLNLEGLAINAFFKDKDPGDKGFSMGIYPTSACIADYLFIPGNTDRIEMVADRINYSTNGCYIPKTWEQDAGYTVRVKKHDMTAAYPAPEEFSKNTYLPVPSELSETIDNILEEIHKTVLNKASIINMTDRELTDQVTTFFNNNFKYNLSPEAPKDGSDPVAYFLTKTRNGHCELFASAAAMILRKYGIPTRYVTGFVCHEQHPSGEYYVARMGDAHAWVEAYLRDEKRWILVDTTPAMTMEQQTSSHWGFWEAWSDRIRYAFEKMFADIKRGYVARAVLNAFLELVNFVWDLFTSPVGLCLILLLSGLIIYRRRLKKRNRSMVLTLDETTEALRKEMTRLERKVARRTGIVRNSQITFNEWLEKIRNSDNVNKAFCAKFADLLEHYNKLRFSAAGITKGQLEIYRKEIKKLLKERIKV